MSEPLATPAATSHPIGRADDQTMPVVVYVLFLLGLATGFVTTLIGAVMAQVLRKGASPRDVSHYVFLVRTAWIGLLGCVVAGLIWFVGLPLTLILVGFLFWWIAGGVLAVITAWFVIRCAAGLIYISRGEAYPRPKAWII